LCESLSGGKIFTIGKKGKILQDDNKKIIGAYIIFWNNTHMFTKRKIPRKRLKYSIERMI
tara:strand:- start:67 stop:246 length:180 start_codon:yes stop_codon:yes gene_type:complete